MTEEELKKLDRRMRVIEYPFGINYTILQKVFVETAKQLNISVADTIRQYAGWKYSRKS